MPMHDWKRVPPAIYRMRALFLAYQGAEEIVPQLVGQISRAGLPLAVAELPWGQKAVLIEQIKDLRERLTPISRSGQVQEVAGRAGKVPRRSRRRSR